MHTITHPDRRESGTMSTFPRHLESPQAFTAPTVNLRLSAKRTALSFPVYPLPSKNRHIPPKGTQPTHFPESQDHSCLLPKPPPHLRLPGPDEAETVPQAQPAQTHCPAPSQSGSSSGRLLDSARLENGLKGSSVRARARSPLKAASFPRASSQSRHRSIPPSIPPAPSTSSGGLGREPAWGLE